MPIPKEIRLGTRGSQLALWQANAVASRITETGGPPFRLVVIRTSGDRLQQAPLSEIGGKRLFVKEIEEALLEGDIDLAVHSSKDMPALLPSGLVIGGVLPREDPLDAFVLSPNAFAREHDGPTTVEAVVEHLGRSPSIGTGSVRRIAQLKRLFPNARFSPIRGNLDTRLRKLDGGDYDALILASAGLRRLGFASRVSLTLPPSVCVPAPGQGIVAIEMRDGDEDLAAIVSRIHDADAGAALAAERAVVDALGGGCQTPIGALATPVGTDQLEIVAAVIALDGSRVVRTTARAQREDATTLGAQVGVRLLEDGAGEILELVRHSQAMANPRSAALSDD